MTQQKHPFYKLFEKKPPSQKVFILRLFVLIILLLTGMLIALGMYSTTTLWFVWNKEGQKNFFIFLLAFIIGVIGNLLASVIYDMRIKRYSETQELDKIKSIQSLANNDLLVDIFKELNYYKNRYCADYVVNAKLKKHQSLDEFFICEVKFHYKKMINTNELVFQFVRIANESDANKLETYGELLSETYLKNEFYHIFDERGFPVIDKKDVVYKLKYLEVMKDGERSNRLEIKETTEHNTIRYQANLGSRNSVESNLITIDYEVEFMMEKESHTSFTIELPTKDIRFEFDYSEVYDEIDLYAYDFLSSHRGPVPLHSLNEQKIRLVKQDWILPKSSFLFIWYKK